MCAVIEGEAATTLGCQSLEKKRVRILQCGTFLVRIHGGIRKPADVEIQTVPVRIQPAFSVGNRAVPEIFDMAINIFLVARETSVILRQHIDV